MGDAAEEESAVALVEAHRILSALQERHGLVGRAGDDAQILDHLVDIENIMADLAADWVFEIVLVRPDPVERMRRRNGVAAPRLTGDLARFALVLTEDAMIVRRDAPLVARMAGLGPGFAINLVVLDQQCDA